MTPDEARQMDEKAQIIDLDTPQVELVGKEEGGKRVLATMNFLSTGLGGQEIDHDTAMKIASKHFQRHYEQIGWFPSGEYPDLVVKRREDGSWFAVSFLAQGSRGKDWEEFPQVHHDERTEKDVLTKGV